ERLADGTIRIRTVRLNYLSYAPLILAESQGHFAEQGIEIEWVPLNRAADGLLPLSQGDLDVLPCIVYPGLFNLIRRGAALRIVADKGHTADGDADCSYMSYVARTELIESGRLKTPADIRGLRFGTSRTRAGFYEACKLLEIAGLTVDDIELVNVPQNVIMQSLAAGNIDITLMGEPHLTQAISEGYAREWLPFQSFIPGHQHSFLIFGPTLIEEDRDAGSAFMVAYRNALLQYNEGATERNIAAIAEATTLDPALVARLCWAPVRASGRVNTDDLVGYQKWAIEQGLLDESVTPDRFWDGSFLDHTDSVITHRSDPEHANER
ncbi:MAG: ABC transporter substrate-binding protein, partial [Gemmatimonadetes bacterium]|nr:ABC transporter substrate-binding protein [Gemmatimonadota bacterium]